MPFTRPAVAASLLLACVAANPPPAKPPTSAPAPVDVVSMGNDVVRFQAPPAPRWAIQAQPDASADHVFFITDDRTGEIDVRFVDYDLDPGLGSAMVKALKDERARKGDQIVLPPTVERDRRFDLVVHEKFKRAGAPIEEFHLWKQVGSKRLMVVAGTTSADAAAAKAELDAAKAAIASAKSNRAAAAQKRK